MSKQLVHNTVVESARKPSFITFTGVDDHTDIDAMRALSGRYPIEWGVLFSPTRQGEDQRYPGFDALRRIVRSKVRLSAHLCGGHARDIMQCCRVEDEIRADYEVFTRFQVNHESPDPSAILFFQERVGRRCIAQTQAAVFPTATDIDWLFDPSCGRGIEAPAFPSHPGRLVGYAGGIGPDNVNAVIERISARGPLGSYRIDMESKVRSNNWLDLALCRKVCELVYDEGA